MESLVARPATGDSALTQGCPCPCARTSPVRVILTPQNAALLVIDYQPIQVASVNSMDRGTLVENVVTLVRAARVYGLPIVHSAVNVRSGRNAPALKEISDAMESTDFYDRTTINAWEDVEFRAAVEATGRRKLVMAALWTEACLTFPTLDALRAGYEVFPVVDAVGGTSLLAHETALRRMEQAGAQLVGIPQLLCELQRDWARTDTVASFVQLLFKKEGSAKAPTAK
jgi:nicotinamidase-related amidase